jgi:beta-N-acetylhexosaminidase
MTPAIFGLSGLTLNPDERAFFRECDPAGYILFGRNIDTPAQVRALTDDLRSIHGRDKLLVSIDQEGGRVARMRPPHFSDFPPGAAFDALFEIAPSSAIAAARMNAHAMGIELAEAGITVDYYPSLDVRQHGAHDVIGDRSFGFEPMRVAAIGRAVLEGLAAAGVAGCIKHMPGHGRTSVDTHKALPTVTATAEELEIDLAPFKALRHAPVGMTGHLVFPEWDAELPATQSPTIIREIIRGQIGFDGLLLTDDLDMEALSGSVPERAERAIAAGCDLALNCWAKMDDMVGIVERLPAMSGQTADRLDRALENTGAAPEGDKTQLLAQRDELLALAGTAA